MKNYLNKYHIKDNPHIIVLLLLIAALFTRFFLANIQIITPDGILYIRVAKCIASGNFQSISEYGFFNLYSFLIVLFQAFFHDWEFSGKMVSVVFGSLTIIPLFLLIRGLFSQNVAILSTLLYIVHPRFVEYSSDVLREPVFWFFSITALWLAWKSISHKRIFLLILSSLATGFAMFTRVEGVLVVAVVVLWILWFFINDKKRGLIYICIFILSIPIVASPSLLLLKNKLNRWEVGHSIEKIPLLILNNGKPLESEFIDQPSPRLQVFFEVSKRHRYTTFIMEIVYKFFKSFNVILFLFFLYGIYKRRFIPYSKNDAYVLIWFSVVFCALFLYMTKVYYMSTRHGLLLVLPALAWAGIGFLEIQGRIRKWLDSKRLFQKYARFDTICLFFLILVILIPQTVSSYRSDKVELKKAGIVLKREGFSKTLFIIQPSLARVAFYSNADAVMLPNEVDDNKIMEFMDNHKGALLLIDELTINDFSPGIRKIADGRKLEKLVFPEMNQYREYCFSIYKIK